MGAMALPFLVLYLTRHLGYTPSQAGFVFAVYGTFALIVAPISGLLCDRFHPVRIMQVSLLGSALAMSLFPFAKSYSLILLMTAVWSAFAELFRPASLMFRAEYAPREMRKQAQVLQRLSNNLGMSIGPAVGGIIAHRSFPSLFYVDAATAVAAGILLIIFFRGKLERKAESSTQVVPSAGPFRDSRFLHLLFAFVVLMMVFFQNESTIGLFVVKELGLTEAFFGSLFTINTVLILLLEVPLNGLTNQWRQSITLFSGAMCFAVGFGMLSFVTGPFGAAASTVIWTFGEMILFPALVTYVMDLAPSSRRGEYMGLYMMALNVALVVGPWGGASIYQHLGPKALWTVAFFQGSLAAILFARLKRPI
jgi:MFS family permease